MVKIVFVQMFKVCILLDLKLHFVKSKLLSAPYFRSNQNHFCSFFFETKIAQKNNFDFFGNIFKNAKLVVSAPLKRLPKVLKNKVKNNICK